MLHWSFCFVNGPSSSVLAEGSGSPCRSGGPLKLLLESISEVAHIVGALSRSFRVASNINHQVGAVFVGFNFELGPWQSGLVALAE